MESGAITRIQEPERNEKEHYKRLEVVMRSLLEADITLNGVKCLFLKRKVQYLGHLVDENGVQANPLKVDAITGMAMPSNHLTFGGS